MYHLQPNQIFLTLDLGTLPLRVMFFCAFSLATLILCVGAISRDISWCFTFRRDKNVFRLICLWFLNAEGDQTWLNDLREREWTVHVCFLERNGVIPFFFAIETLPNVLSIYWCGSRFNGSLEASGRFNECFEIYESVKKLSLHERKSTLGSNIWICEGQRSRQTIK